MRPSSRKGFTIIELLVAVGVTALLVTLMINIVTTVLTNWNRTSGTLSSGNQARMILDQISQDLQGAILKTDGNVWIAASIQAGGGAAGMSKEAWFAGKPSTVSINPTSLDIEEYSFGQAGVWLRFFTTPSDINQAGDLTTISAPRAVSYQMIRRQVGGTDAAYLYQLYRSEVFPDATFTAGYNLYDAATGYNSANNGVARGAVQNIRTPHEDQVIANGVIDFGVRFFERDSRDADNDGNTAELFEVFPVDRRPGGKGEVDALAATSDITKAQTTPIVEVDDTSHAFPAVAEVMIRVLTPEGVRLIEAKEQGLPVPETWAEIAEQNSNVYTRRIELKSTAL